MTFEGRLEEAVRRSQAYMPAEAWDQAKLLLAPEALATMAGVTAAWAVSHFFGVGEAADAIMLVGAGAMFGWSALQIGQEFYRFANLVRQSASDSDLDEAARHFAKAVVLGGVTLVTAILFKNRPRNTLKEPHFGGAAQVGVPPARSPGLRYKPTISERPMAGGLLGVTTEYGDIVVNANLAPFEKTETVLHERVHQFFTPKFYFLRDIRVQINIEAYNRSYLLRFVEEALAEGYALLRMRGRGVLAAISFPVRNGYVTVAKMGQEAAGFVLGIVNVSGLSFRVLFASSKPNTTR
jgi:hypothetical protein